MKRKAGSKSEIVTHVVGMISVKFKKEVQRGAENMSESLVYVVELVSF